jgi:acetyl esterase/lipase
MRYLFLALACCLILPAHAARIDVIEDVVYGQGYVRAEDGDDFVLKDLLLDVYLPEKPGDTPHPAVVLMHGGSFMHGTRKHDELTDLARYLARRGYVCFSGDYRLMKDDPPAQTPWSIPQLRRAMHACFVDAKAMVSYARANAGQYHLDPDRIAFVGDSAGGFAAYALAATGDDQYRRDREDLPIPDANPQHVSAKPNAVVVLWSNGDFVLDQFDANDPPLMILHGTDDGEFGTPFRAAEAAVKAATTAGIDVTFHPIPDADHGAWDADINGKDINHTIEAFLNAKL